MVQTASAIAQSTRQEEEKSLDRTTFSYLNALTKTPLDQTASQFSAEVIADKKSKIEKSVQQRVAQSNSSSRITAGEIASVVGAEAVSDITQLNPTLDVVLPHSVYANVRDAIDRQVTGIVTEVAARENSKPDQATPQTQKESPVAISQGDQNSIATTTPQPVAQAISEDSMLTTEMPSPLKGNIKIQIPVVTKVADEILAGVTTNSTQTEQPWLNIQPAAVNKPIVTNPLQPTNVQKKSVNIQDLDLRAKVTAA